MSNFTIGLILTYLIIVLSFTNALLPSTNTNLGKLLISFIAANLGALSILYLLTH